MMSITEANHVARLVHLLDGSYTGTLPEQLEESVEYLRQRAEKPLQVRLRLDQAALRKNVDDLLSRTRYAGTRTGGAQS